MSGKSLRSLGMATLVALAALAAGSMRAPTAQRGVVLGKLTAPETAHAQAAVCVRVTCQRDNPDFAIVAVAESPQTGAYLVAGGMTLYTLSADQPGTGRSKCPYYGGYCTNRWPAYLLPSDGLQAEAGIPGTFGSYASNDAKTGVTYNGSPLYFCTCDTMRGDRNGDGVTDDWGTWSVAKP